MTQELMELKELYLALGVGGLSFIVLIVIVLYLLRVILPILNQIKQDGAVTQSVIQNNTKAIEEMSKSNQNVAMALTILDKSMSNVHCDVQKVMETNEDIEKRLIVIQQNVCKGGML